MTTQPPRLATWLLNQFTSSANGENVAGDIAERYRNRRSRVWYWRQVIAAIAVSIVRELRTHTSVAVRAVLVGWGLLLVLAQTQCRLLVWLWNVSNGETPPWSPIRQSWVMDGWTYFGGWVPPGDPYISVLVSCTLAFFTGWLLTQLYRVHSMVLFVASWFIVQIYLFVGGLNPLLLVLNAQSRFWSRPVWTFVPKELTGGTLFIPFPPILAMFCTMAGGLLATLLSPAPEGDRA